MSYTSRKVYHKRNALLNALFKPEGDPTYLDDKGKPARVRYVLRDPKDAAVAEATTADHGVCLKCGLIAGHYGGTCHQCGHRPAPAPKCFGSSPSLALCWGPILKEAKRLLNVA